MQLPFLCTPPRRRTVNKPGLHLGQKGNCMVEATSAHPTGSRHRFQGGALVMRDAEKFRVRNRTSYVR
ncbi:MAG TPA: hypothetical protein VIH78_04800 [Terriglobales bacterium]